MSIFSVSGVLIDPPQLRHGFWYSYDSTQAQGHMLTLSNFVATYFNVALGILVVWAVSRLWRIGCVLLFYFSYQPDPSWEESQNGVLIVNNKNPLDGVIESYQILTSRANAYGQYNRPQQRKPLRYRRARNVVIIIMLTGSITVGLKLSIPLLIALVPVTRMGLVVPKDCSDGPVKSEETRDEITAIQFVKKNKAVNVVFAIVDRIVNNLPLDIGGSSEDRERAKLPEPKQSFEYICPQNVSACSSPNPFSFSSEYTLSAHHFGLNVETPFSLRVSESCYRPESRVSAISPLESHQNSSSDFTNVTSYGLFYGPTISSDGRIKNHTLDLSTSQLRAGYAIARAAATANDSHSFWLPDPSVVQGGDTTLLLYYTGGVWMLNTSSDPMFCTGKLTHEQVYHHKDNFAPIICDTKYVICDNSRDGGGCSNPGGMTTQYDWLRGKQGVIWKKIGATLSNHRLPPIYRVAAGPVAILASQSMEQFLQYAPANITAFRELSRLSQAGMVALASIAQLHATGFWTEGMPLALLPEPAPDSICHQVIMESSAVTTIPVIPYVLFIAFSVSIVLVSYLSSFPPTKKLFFSSLDRFFHIWALHRSGQLHREVTERLRTRNFKRTSTTERWPTAPYQSGPTVTRQELARFASGNTGLLD